MSSLLSFLNQKLFSENRNPHETAADTTNGQVKQQWKEFIHLYQENEKVFRLSETVDIAWAAQKDKAAELEASIDSFPRTANIILEALLRLANLHPSFGVAISSYYSLIALDLTRASEYRKVLFVLLQIQTTLCTLFQLRHIKSITVRTEAEKTSLQRLIVTLAVAITNCGSDLNYFMSVKSPMRLIYVNTFEKKFMAHINIFVKKRNELQKMVDSIIGNRTFNMGGKLKVNETPQQAEKIFQLFLAHFLARLRTTDESEAVSLITDKMPNVKEDPQGAQSKFFEIYVGFVSKEEAFEQAGYIPEVLSKVLNEGGSKKLGAGPLSHLPRFNKLLDVQNRSLEQNLVRMQKQTLLMRQSDMKVEMPFIISVPTMTGGKRLILLDIPTRVPVKDPEVHQIWTQMNIGSNVDIRTLILKLREYFADERSSSDKWVLDYVDLAHIQPIAEALGCSGPKSVDIQQVHHFALSKPDGLSFSHWLAYWAAGWRINIMNYRDQIYSIMRQMHDAFDSIHIANRAHVGTYLGSPFFIRVESLFRSIILTSAAQDISVSDDPRLVELAYHIAHLQEEEIITNLKDVSFTLAAASEAKLVGGPGRAETWILPLLYLLLQRHLSIIKIARSYVLDEGEMMVHTQSLVSVFRVFESRIRDLEAMFKLEEKHDTERLFQGFGYGMFSTYIDKKKSMSTERSTLSTFRSASAPPKYNRTSKEKGNPVDASILAKGPGQPFEYDDIDRSFPALNHKPHPLQGAWYGSSLQLNISSFSADQRFTGNVETLLFPSQVFGKTEPEIPKRLDGRLKVYFQVSAKGYADVLFKGRYDPDEDAIVGEIASYEGYDVDSIANLSFSSEPDRCQSVAFTRARPAVTRFKYLLEESPVDPSLSLARRRWAFSTQVVLLEAQIKLGSSKVIRRGMQDRRNWTKKLTRSGDNDPKQDSIEREMRYLLPENTRLYSGLILYLLKRKTHHLGGIQCDGCDAMVTNTRYTCITCRDEDIAGSAVDLCSDCVETPQLSERYQSAFAHHISHSLIRTLSYIPHFEISELVRQAKILSDDIKSLFREADAIGSEDPFADQPKSSLKCACCENNITLPCLACVTCSLHPLICLECDEKREHIRRENASFAIHSRQHRLLRVYDSAAVDSGVGSISV